MMMAAQSKGFPLASLLTNVNPPNLIKPEAESDSLLSIVMVQGLPNLTKPHLGNLSKPDIHRCVMMTNDDILAVLSGLRILRNPKFFSTFKISECMRKAGITMPANASPSFSRRGDAEGFETSTHTREGEFSDSIKKEFLESIKKGSHKAALWDAAEKNQALGLVPSFRSLSRHESLTQELKLPCPATALICSSSSSSKRMCFMVLPLRSNAFFCLSSCIGSYQYYNGNTDGNYQSEVIQYQSVKTAKPDGALTPIGLLTTTDSNSIEVAMSNRTTHPQGRQSYTCRFLALSAIGRNVIHITATTEREAREQSPAGCVMVFAGRIRQEVRHA